MSHVRVESSVRTNKKFLQAGPAASWLWLCGVAYCQDTLTDGYIPAEALEFLGVKGTGKYSPHRLATALVLAGLWEADDRGGWHIHDYLEHNKSAAAVKQIKEDKKTAGARGGEASGRSRAAKHSASALDDSVLQHSVNPYVQTHEQTHVVGSSQERDSQGKTKLIGPRDVWLKQLAAVYPEHRITTGYMTSCAFNQQFDEDHRDDADIWAEMREALDNQKVGHEWRVKGMVPSLLNWLKDGKWRQRHEVAPATEMLSEKTARTLASAAAFIREGDRGSR